MGKTEDDEVQFLGLFTTITRRKRKKICRKKTLQLLSTLARRVVVIPVSWNRREGCIAFAQVVSSLPWAVFPSRKSQINWQLAQKKHFPRTGPWL